MVISYRVGGPPFFITIMMIKENNNNSFIPQGKMLLILLSILYWNATGEVYSSYENIRYINEIEDHLVDLLYDYIAEERERLDTLERFQQYVENSKNYTEPGETYIKYPTNQFNVIHRFVADWNNLENWTKSRNEAIYSALDTYREFFPVQDDVNEAITAIHRLQDIYKITAGHFSRGGPLVSEKGSVSMLGQPFNEKSLLLFVKNAFEKAEWHKCADWGQQAYYQLQIHSKHNPPSSALWFDTADYFAYCLYQAGEIYYALEVTVEMLVHYPDHDRLVGNLNYYSALLKNGPVNKIRSRRSVISEPLVNLSDVSDDDVEITFIPKLYPGADQVVFTEDWINQEIQDKHNEKWVERLLKYQKLCRENPHLTLEMKKQIDRLICYYKQDTPRSYLKPIKVEIAWPSPRITVFHDLISDEEGDALMSLAQPHLNRATVHNKDTGELENAHYRVSKTAWLENDLPEDKNGIVRRVNRRMEDATELSHDYAELQQVNNYGIGGQYEPHYDMTTLHDLEVQERSAGAHGNRIATLLVYLAEPLAGGATIFTDSGVRLLSKKNAAVFWYNLLPNGDPDLITRHAGCPVLAGTKWVMNKWFHANDQIFTRPCDLQQFKRDKDTKLYNGKYTI